MNNFSVRNFPSVVWSAPSINFYITYTELPVINSSWRFHSSSIFVTQKCNRKVSLTTSCYDKAIWISVILTYFVTSRCPVFRLSCYHRNSVLNPLLGLQKTNVWRAIRMDNHRVVRWQLVEETTGWGECRLLSKWDEPGSGRISCDRSYEAQWRWHNFSEQDYIWLGE